MLRAPHDAPPPPAVMEQFTTPNTAPDWMSVVDDAKSAPRAEATAVMFTSNSELPPYSFTVPATNTILPAATRQDCTITLLFASALRPALKLKVLPVMLKSVFTMTSLLRFRSAGRASPRRSAVPGPVPIDTELRITVTVLSSAIVSGPVNTTATFSCNPGPVDVSETLSTVSDDFPTSPKLRNTSAFTVVVAVYDANCGPLSVNTKLLFATTISLLFGNSPSKSSPPSVAFMSTTTTDTLTRGAASVN